MFSANKSYMDFLRETNAYACKILSHRMQLLRVFCSERVGNRVGRLRTLRITP